MITFKLITYENRVRFGVTISALEAGIEKAYEPLAANALILKFNDIMLGSTVGNVNGETEIYAHDIAAVFGLLKIPIKFVDDNEIESTIDAKRSGILGHSN